MNRVFPCDTPVGSAANARVKSSLNVHASFTMCLTISEDCAYCSKRKKKSLKQKIHVMRKINGFVWEKGIFLCIFIEILLEAHTKKFLIQRIIQ